jgi:type I restriction enzyme, S subunit
MSSSPKVASLAELCKVVIDNRGKTCPTAASGTPLIATNCVNNDGLYPAYEKVRYVDQAVHKSWFRGHPEPGDLLLVLKGSPGRVCVVPDPVDFCIAQDMVAIRADEAKVYPRFLFALLRSFAVQQRIRQLHVGTMIPHFKKGDFDKLHLSIPDRGTQELIGDAHFQLCQKIELNRRVNRTLESIARSIFKSWFVDFDPVRKKMEGGEVELPTDLLVLWPDSLESSVLRPIPRGWRVSEIGNEVAIVGGSTPSTRRPEYWDGDICFATPKDLSGLLTSVLLRTDRGVTQRGAATVSSGVLPRGTVLMSSRAPIGYLAITEIPVCVNQGFIAMKCDGSLPNHFVLNWARCYMDAIVGNANGTTFLEISKRNFRPLPVLVPPQPLVERFAHAAEVLHRRVVRNLCEIEALVEIRDALLPRLIDGTLALSPPKGRASEVAS